MNRRLRSCRTFMVQRNLGPRSNKPRQRRGSLNTCGALQPLRRFSAKPTTAKPANIMAYTLGSDTGETAPPKYPACERP